MDREIVPVPGYEGYTVSNDGIVYSKKGVPLVPKVMRKGYLRVRVYKGGRKHWLVIHQAVARAFIPNPNKYNCINHKDENKTNNRAGNLEWCTLAYNLGYGSKPQRTAYWNQVYKGHKVVHMKGGKEVLYPSINAASKATKICRSAITRQCNTSGEWRYA